MNTKPDETLLALWVEDELAGSDLAGVEQWAAGQPDWLARREDSRAWRSLIHRALPAEEEPPHLEFFHARIARAAAQEGPARASQAPAAARERRPWSSLGLPLAAAAGMALCFWAGTRFGGPPPAAPAPPVVSRPAPGGTNVYVPEQGVKAKVYESAESESVVIVLDGVQAIPDSLELPEQATSPAGLAPGSSTADRGETRHDRIR